MKLFTYISREKKKNMIHYRQRQIVLQAARRQHLKFILKSTIVCDLQLSWTKYTHVTQVIFN
jgi:hypothetical protein